MSPGSKRIADVLNKRNDGWTPLRSCCWCPRNLIITLARLAEHSEQTGGVQDMLSSMNWHIQTTAGFSIYTRWRFVWKPRRFCHNRFKCRGKYLGMPSSLRLHFNMQTVFYCYYRSGNFSRKKSSSDHSARPVSQSRCLTLFLCALFACCVASAQSRRKP